MPEPSEADLVREGYDRIAPTYLSTAVSVQRYFGRVFRFLDEHVRPGTTLLDVGCGPGFLTASLPESVGVTGTDISPAMVAVAGSARSSGRYLVHDYHASFPPELGTFDVVLASSCFEFCRDIRLVLANLARVLAPAGTLFFTVNERRPGLAGHELPKTPIAPQSLPDVSAHFWSAAETAEALQAAGLYPVSYEFGPGWLNRSTQVEHWYGYWRARR